MSYATERAKLGRIPIVVVELDLDKCSLTYGTAPCTAAGGSGNECYNTRATCQDTANYTKTTQTYKFCQPRTGLPIGETLFPVVGENVEFTPTEIRPDKGISLRAAVDIEVRDFPHHDRGVDPYVANRSYDATTQGTFFGKLLARNPYYIGRPMRVLVGYITDTWSWGNFQTHLYVIDSIDGPRMDGDGNLTYTITGKDLLKLGDDKRIKIPAPSDGKLTGSLAAGATTSFTLDSAATLADYPTGGATVAIGKEILSYASRSGYVCSTLSRGLHGTSDIAHNADDNVQVCASFNANIVNVIHDILEDYIGIDGDTYIPFDEELATPTGTNDEWDDEKDNWLNVTINTVIPKPTGALKLLDALCRENQIDLWWDDEAQQIKLKTNTPPLGNAAVTELNEKGNIIEGSFKVRDMTDMRVSRVITYYDKINKIEGEDPDNFARQDIFIDSDRESADTYDEERAEVIKSIWFTASNATNVSQQQQRMVSRFGRTPKLLEFELDAKDAILKTGDLADITTRHLQDVDGGNLTERYQIIYKKEKQLGHSAKYKALRFSFLTRNAFIGPNTLGTYGSESEANKNAYAFVGPNTGVFSDGGQLYLII